MTSKKGKASNGIDTNGFLKGCTICNEGMANSMDKMIENHGLSETAAADATADSVNKRIGVDMFTGDALRKRYRRQRGHEDGASPLKKKEQPAWKCKDGKTITAGLGTLKKEIKKAKELAAIDSKTARKIYNLSHEIIGEIKELINWEED